MFTVVRADVLELAASVPARQASEIRVGQRVHFAAGGHDLEGRRGAHQPHDRSHEPIHHRYVRVPNGAGTLKGNAFATGRIVSRTVDGAVPLHRRCARQCVR